MSRILIYNETYWGINKKLLKKTSNLQKHGIIIIKKQGWDKHSRLQEGSVLDKLKQIKLKGHYERVTHKEFRDVKNKRKTHIRTL